MFDFFLNIFIGLALGLLTGLIPGLHPNTLSQIFLNLDFQGLSFAIMLASLGIANVIFSFFPAIFLGAPNSENFLSLLPGHRFLLKGKGFYAIKLCIFGFISSLVFSISIFLLYINFLKEAEGLITLIIPFILSIILLINILDEKRKFFALLITLACGALGILTLNFGVARNPLFVAITGLFGLSTVVFSLKQKSNFPNQNFDEKNINFKSAFKGSVFGSFASILQSIFPALGASNSAYIVNKVNKKMSDEEYLISLASINLAGIIFSIFTLFSIDKVRTGVAAFIKKSIDLSFENLIFLIIAIALTVGISIILFYYFSKIFIKFFSRINYFYLNLFILVFLLILTFFLSDLNGFIVLGLATFIGLACHYLNIKKSILMGYLIFPTLLFYLGFKI